MAIALNSIKSSTGFLDSDSFSPSIMKSIKNKSLVAYTKSQEDKPESQPNKRALRKKATIKSKQEHEDNKRDNAIFPERDIDTFEHSLHHERRERM